MTHAPGYSLKGRAIPLVHPASGRSDCYLPLVKPSRDVVQCPNPPHLLSTVCMFKLALGQEIAKEPQKERKGIKFAEPPKAESEPQPQSMPAKKPLPRRHTGYAFDHPGFESFHANEVRSS